MTTMWSVGETTSSRSDLRKRGTQSSSFSQKRLLPKVDPFQRCSVSLNLQFWAQCFRGAIVIGRDTRAYSKKEVSISCRASFEMRSRAILVGPRATNSGSYPPAILLNLRIIVVGPSDRYFSPKSVLTIRNM